MSQLSLVFFTVLAQSAVGLFISLGLVEMLARPNEQVMTRSFMAVFVLLAIGAIASVTHLSQPLRMFNVMFGVAHASPLSLEIVALSLFGGAGVVYTAMRLFGIAPGLQKLVLPVAMVLGIVLILAIAKVYTLATVPTWNSNWTTFQFLMTAAVVGPLAAAALLRFQSVDLGAVQVLADKALATTVLMTMAISLVGYVGYLFWLGQLPVAVNPLAMLSYGQMLAMVRMVLLVGGVLMFAVSAMRGGSCGYQAATSFVMVLVSEFMGRAFFYDIYLSAGSGM
ncbi:dimethyl sulfoxide reductase anchor subunit family protein [Endozoicomonas lisbonensis]|uniref:Anaerobic dimethyl sulfoxide reductase subunit C (Anchor subunit) n=1 Tax=Endozoicomonas lisbonensis TaxID=3120522 RepID=A0ABV2SPK1_9GAMM